MKLEPLADIPAPPAALHSRIAQSLRVQILDGRYPPLSQLPSESELCERFGTSRITVRQALSGLQRQGLIFTRQGRGSFVSRPKAFQDVSTLTGFAESMAERGHEVLNLLLDAGPVRADAQVARRLGVAPGTAVTGIRRVRLLDCEPVSLEITYLAQAVGPRVAKADLASRDIFLILEQDCGVTLGHAELAIDATLADAVVASALGLEEGAPVLRIERLTHDAQGRPIDFEYLHFRADTFQYRLRVDRRRQER